MTIEYEIETKEQIAHRKKVFQTGVHVRRNGGKITDNPYEKYQVEYRHWRAGWEAGA